MMIHLMLLLLLFSNKASLYSRYKANAKSISQAQVLLFSEPMSFDMVTMKAFSKLITQEFMMVAATESLYC